MRFFSADYCAVFCKVFGCFLWGSELVPMRCDLGFYRVSCGFFWYYCAYGVFQSNVFVVSLGYRIDFHWVPCSLQFSSVDVVLFFEFTRKPLQQWIRSIAQFKDVMWKSPLPRSSLTLCCRASCGKFSAGRIHCAHIPCPSSRA